MPCDWFMSCRPRIWSLRPIVFQVLIKRDGVQKSSETNKWCGSIKCQKVINPTIDYYLGIIFCRAKLEPGNLGPKRTRRQFEILKLDFSFGLFRMQRKFAFCIESVQFMTIMLKELTLLSGFMTSIKPINNMFCCACAFLFSVSYSLFSDASMYKCVWRDLLINPHLLLHCKSTCFMLWKWPLKLVINHVRVHLSYFELGKTNKNVFQIFCAKSKN